MVLNYNLWSLIYFHHVTIEIANANLNISTISQWFILPCFMHSCEWGWLIGNYGMIGIWRHDCCMHYTWGMQPMGHLITRIYNSLLYCIPDKLLNRIQRIPNYIVQVVLGLHKFSHIIAALATLQKALNGQALAYMVDLLQPLQKLRSADERLLSQLPCRVKT